MAGSQCSNFKYGDLHKRRSVSVLITATIGLFCQGRVAVSNPVFRSYGTPAMQGVLLFPGVNGASVLPIMPIILPITSVQPPWRCTDLVDVSGSIRQRGPSSWELRVYSGLDHDTGKRRYRTATVIGNRGDAERGLAELVAAVRSERSIGSASTVSELLEAWFVVASDSWAPTTIRQTRYLHSQLGAIRVGELTPSVIDAAHVRLRVSGGGRGKGLSSGTLARVHVVLRSTLAQAQRWDGSLTTRWNEPIASGSVRPNASRRPLMRSRH